MGAALQRMLARVGKTEADISKRSLLGKSIRRRGVAASPEIDRIVQYPRNDADVGRTGTDEELVDLLTEFFKSPDGTMVLKNIQARCLQTVHDYGGLVALVRVGGGKTLVAFLAAMAAEAERPVLLVPAKLYNKTVQDLRVLARHWTFIAPTVITYEKLSNAASAELLETLQPDFIGADEAQKLKNKRAACTRRVERFMDAHPETVFVALSGTLTTKSIHEYWHILEWALGRNRPLPNRWDVMAEWGRCLDTGDDDTLEPGALRALIDEFGPQTDEPLSDRSYTRDTCRLAYRERLYTWPGVVASRDPGVASSLSVVAVEGPKLPAAIDDAFRGLRKRWEMPDGFEIMEATEVWRHARELSSGFYYVWDPRPPEPWREACSAWAKFVRNTIKKGHIKIRGTGLSLGEEKRIILDTELQVAHACSLGHLFSPEYDAWKAIRGTFKPNKVPVWVDLSVVHWACLMALAVDDGGPALIWTEHRAFGEMCEKHSGVPFFSEGGLAKDGRSILDYQGPAIVSANSIGEGFNLQDRWSRNVVVSAPPNGAKWEQMMGRTHRDGQPADEVSFEVLISCLEHWTGMQKVLDEARYIEGTTGVPQKILYADVVIPSAEDVAEYRSARWRR